MVANPQEIDDFAAYAKQKLCREGHSTTWDELFANWKQERQAAGKPVRELDSQFTCFESVLKDMHLDREGLSCEAYVDEVVRGNWGDA